MGKSWEVVDAIAKSIADAKKNLVHVTMADGTVPYNVKVKNKSAVVMVHPASKGTGLIAGGAVRKVLNVAGYTDVLAKRYGSTNLINNARATIDALRSFKKVNSDFSKAKTEEKVPKEEKVEKKADKKIEK
jgi:small subunit ribosomal protein S5